jgi:signal transduction histidine kinase
VSPKADRVPLDRPTAEPAPKPQRLSHPGSALKQRLANRIAAPSLIRPRAVLSSFTFRLALLYALLLAGSVVLLLGFIHWSTAGYMSRQSDATIEAEIRGLSEQYRRRGLVGLTTLVAERSARDPSGAGLYLLADSDFRPLVGNIDTWPGAEPDRDGWIDFRVRERTGSGDRDGPEHAARGKVFRLRGDLRLMVGRDVHELAALGDLLGDALRWGLALTVALAVLGGWVMSGRVVRRIEAINQVGLEIMEGDLSRRIPTDGSGDELDRLAVNLNRMLGRIEALMASVRQVSDNIAHDLRTPLGRLHTKLSRLRDQELAPKAAARVDEAIADAEELLSAFNGLLRIARVESGSRRAAFADLDPVVLLQDVAELYEPLAADKGQTLSVTPASTEAGAALPSTLIHGDRDLLFQALANLLDNAIKYTPAGGEIRIAFEPAAAGGVALLVADSGPGIPAELRGKVLQRFYRVDASRSEPGHGLGLSLVQAVSQLHDADLRLEDAGPGLRVSLTFPASLARREVSA